MLTWFSEAHCRVSAGGTEWSCVGAAGGAVHPSVNDEGHQQEADDSNHAGSD